MHRMSDLIVRPRFFSFVVLLALPAFAATAATPAASPPETFRDRLAVREARKTPVVEVRYPAGPAATTARS